MNFILFKKSNCVIILSSFNADKEQVFVLIIKLLAVIAIFLLKTIAIMTSQTQIFLIF